MDVRYCSHPDDSRFYTTDELREKYLIERVFVKDKIPLTYSHQDRMIAGGAMPVTKVLELTAGEELRADYFLQRRELGVINIGGKGKVYLDDQVYELNTKDGLYVGMGIKKVCFESVDSSNPAKFYLNSSPAHMTYPTVKVTPDMANPVKCGDPETLNVRTINQYIHPAVLKSCQLTMGMTVLEKGSAWNTWPCHTHERRMEVYMYFDLQENDRVFHMMGTPEETRHIVMKNEQAVISPSWSIHCGFATRNYTFIWGMCGENQTFDDMDHCDLETFK